MKVSQKLPDLGGHLEQTLQSDSEHFFLKVYIVAQV